MYSGYNLIYGMELTIDDIILLFDLEEDYYEEEENIFEIHDRINSMLEKNFVFIKFIKKPCCFHERFSVYIGVNLGENDIQYRSNVEFFEDFQMYDDFFQSKLDNIKKKYLSNKDEIENEFKSFFEIYSDSIPNDLFFFTIPNGCECFT
jgi:hypothetical protein